MTTQVKVYGYRNVLSDMVYIGKEEPGKDFYVSSSNNSDFWRDYSKGLLQKTILFIADGNVRQNINKASALEHFSLQFAFDTIGKDMLYNPRNNAHSAHERLLSSDEKRVAVDWISKKGAGIVFENSFIDDRERMTELVRKIEEGEFETQMVPLSDLIKFGTHQVRVEKYLPGHVNNIAQALIEKPENLFDPSKFHPIIVVVTKDGNFVIDGNNRVAAVKKVRGIENVPVIFLNETEFGETEKIREGNYDLFGIMMNREDEVMQEKNSNSDLKRSFQKLIEREGLDLSKTHHVERARKLAEDRFLGTVIPQKKKFAGVWKSFMNDFQKGVAEELYGENLKIYESDFLAAYGWEKYESNDIAYIVAQMSKTEHAEAYAYVSRRMKNLKLNKGAIILHYTNANEYSKFKDGYWLDDLRETIAHMGVDVVVDVLPAH